MRQYFWLNGEILQNKYFQYFDRSKRRHDRAKIGLVGHHHWPLFKNSFEPWYCRNRHHIHLTQEPPVTIVNDDLIDESQPVTMQFSVVNCPSVTRESDANLEPNPSNANASSSLSHSTRVRSVPVWHNDYVM